MRRKGLFLLQNKFKPQFTQHLLQQQRCYSNLRLNVPVLTYKTGKQRKPHITWGWKISWTNVSLVSR